MNAYEIKTGLSRARISHLMDAESWFNAKKAVELGFADGILGGGAEKTEDMGDGTGAEGMMFSRTAVANSLLSKLIPKPEEGKTEPSVAGGSHRFGSAGIWGLCGGPQAPGRHPGPDRYPAGPRCEAGSPEQRTVPGSWGGRFSGGVKPAPDHGGRETGMQHRV